MIKRGTKTGTKAVIKKEPATKEDMLKAEVHYFKGMSIFLTVMMICIFVAFGALFSAMYMETKLLRIILQDAFDEARIEIVPDVQPPQF
jgi:hypothetical protein